MENEIQQLQERVKELEDELDKTKEHLKTYTSPLRNKKYYENHKEQILERMKQNPQQVVDKEKRKVLNKKAYLKKKEKLNKIENEII
jgi:hypothetical protein